MDIKKYFDVYKVQIKNNFVREAIYRTNFLTALLSDLVWIGLEFGLFSVIYHHVPLLAGWTKPQVFFFLGVFFLSDALFVIFFQRNFWGFSDLVNKGDLDIFLTKPIAPLFLILSRSMNLTNFFNVFLGLGILWRYKDAAGFAGGWHWIHLLCWLIIGVMTALLLRFLSCVLTFWTERGWALTHLYYQLFQLGTKPDVLYPTLVRKIITTLLPFAFIASYPARALLFGLSWGHYMQVVGVLLGLFFVNFMLWSKGLERYQSASS